MLEHERWIAKAESDLMLVKNAFDSNLDIMDSAIFHTQQCAEKALKAFLISKDQKIRKIHDLELLVEFCSRIDPEFMRLLFFAANLDPYCFDYRYPCDDLSDSESIPSRDDVQQAIGYAEEILNFVKNKI